MNRVGLKTAMFFARKCVTLVLVLAFVFVDLAPVFHYDWWPEVPRAHALTGDYSIFKETTGTDSVTTSNLNLTWDATVAESSNIQLQANGHGIDLSDGGKYLVLYNAIAQVGTNRMCRTLQCLPSKRTLVPCQSCQKSKPYAYSCGIKW